MAVSYITPLSEYSGETGGGSSVDLSDYIKRDDIVTQSFTFTDTQSTNASNARSATFSIEWSGYKAIAVKSWVINNSGANNTNVYAVNLSDTSLNIRFRNNNSSSITMKCDVVILYVKE